MQHDADSYEDADEFRPERFLAHPHGLKAGASTTAGRMATYTFGRGRRACPGEQFAHSSTLLAMAKILWAFEIVPPAAAAAAGGGSGIDMDPVTGYHDGVVLSPKPFKVEMRLRNEAKRDGLVRDHEQAQEALRGIGV